MRGAVGGRCACTCMHAAQTLKTTVEDELDSKEICPRAAGTRRALSLPSLMDAFPNAREKGTSADIGGPNCLPFKLTSADCRMGVGVGTQTPPHNLESVENCLKKGNMKPLFFLVPGISTSDSP